MFRCVPPSIAIFLAAPALVAPALAAPDVAPLPEIARAQNGGAPQIHGARIVGATPERPFLFQVAATGDAPLLYRTRDLPPGLILDAQSGIIRGKLRYAGNTVVQIEVSNARGVARRNLTIVGGRHLLARTPPMGWNSWNAYGCGVTGAKVRAAADDLRKSGLAARGYSYVNVDDCWQGERDARGELQGNAKFGDMKKLGDDLHARGLKFGIYSSPGPQTCAGYEGSWNHEFQDARAYAAWGVDYLKYDYCTYKRVATEVGRARAIAPYTLMRDALDGSGRDIFYSVCQYGKNEVWKWAGFAPVWADSWRISRDIKGSYGSMARIGFGGNGLYNWAAPGRWNDPDMLYLHKLSPDEQLTHLSLWSLRAAPLLIGSDISQLSPFTLDALANSEVIEVDQDPLGIAARRIGKVGQTEVWARPLWDGTLVVGLFNRGKNPARVAVRWADLGVAGALPVRDLWRGRDLGDFDGAYAAEIAGHGVALLKIGAPNAGDYTPRWAR